MFISLNVYPLHCRVMESVSCMNNAIVSAETILSCAVNNALLGLPANAPLHLLQDHALAALLTDRAYEMYNEDVRTFTDIYNYAYDEVVKNYLPSLDAQINGNRGAVTRLIMQHGMAVFQVNMGELHE